MKRRAGRRQWPRLLLLAVMALTIGLSAYRLNARHLTGNAMPMPFGYGISVVLSGSMEPTLYANDLVVIKACDDYAVGDVIVYQDGSILVIHRIIDRTGDLVQTQGDANNAADEPIEMSAIKGKLIYSLKGIGGVVRVIAAPTGTVSILAAAVLLLLLANRRENEADQAELDAIRAEIEELKGKKEFLNHAESESETKE